MYSDIAAQLANNTYKVKARVFIQELFLDSSFSAVSFYTFKAKKENLYLLLKVFFVFSYFKNQ